MVFGVVVVKSRVTFVTQGFSPHSGGPRVEAQPWTMPLRSGIPHSHCQLTYDVNSCTGAGVSVLVDAFDRAG